ncbi:DUF262 domain-containing protein [Flavobacterium sp. RHBU_24]|uniref:DUF262 domain-containing protein n=1 Tax=Flavobacterium sp. RHBU_24 TaxID=3391185 RepID=UPI0039856582
MNYNDRPYYNELPYDPSDVDIRQQTFTVGYIVDMIYHGEIELWREKDYQRKIGSWSKNQKSRLIESLIMRIPLPIFYFDGSERPWKVVDGLHRLTTLHGFIVHNDFTLHDLEYLKDLEGYNFSELPFQYQRVIQQSQIQAYVINPGTPDKVKLNIFQRINTGGSSLSRQEIRNAYYRGVPADYLDTLSTLNEFLRATQNKFSEKKMKNKEAVLRFFAFYKFLDDYAPPMEKFLDFAMEEIYRTDPAELQDIKYRFANSMWACNRLFNENAFYYLNRNGHREGNNINIALFETWAVNLARLSENELDKIVNSKNLIIPDFLMLLQDLEFNRSFTSSTSGRRAVQIRFQHISYLIQHTLNAY